MNVKRSADVSLKRIAFIYVFGFISGLQVALYMYNYFDDGVANPLSLAIGMAMVGLSIIYIVNTFRRSSAEMPTTDTERSP